MSKITISGLHHRAPSSRLLLVVLAAAGVGGCWPDTGLRVPPEDRPPGSLRSAYLGDKWGPKWTIEGRIVSESPPEFMNSVLAIDDNPCMVLKERKPFSREDVRKLFRKRDQRLQAIHKVVLEHAAGVSVQIVSLDFLRWRQPRGFKPVEYARVVFFNCNDPAVEMKTRLVKLGAHQVDGQQMGTIRPWVETLVSPAKRESYCMSNNNHDVLLVSFYDGQRWKARPWFYALDRLASEFRMEDAHIALEELIPYLKIDCQIPFYGYIHELP